MKRMYKLLGNIEQVFCGILLAIIVSILFIAVVLRTIGHPVSWGYDIALLASAWLVFIGADVAFRKGEFVDVDVAFNLLHKNIQKTFQTISFLLILGFLIAMTYYGTHLSITTWNRSFSGIPFLSFTWATLSIPVSALCMTITLLYRTFVEKSIEGTNQTLL
ncbi:TRAP transporter small permease subunit [Neobacillus niacini]|uniref:TRAP transporter small permease n=1 Tax=Neobacillus niacini TaxID=86668 RepID=UPI003000B303